MNTLTVIVAAGIGSRFSGGIKQLEPVGPNGEIIMDYSIHDSLGASLNKVFTECDQMKIISTNEYSYVWKTQFRENENQV